MIIVGRNDLARRPDLQPLRLGWMYSMIAVSSASHSGNLGERYTPSSCSFWASGLWLGTVDATASTATEVEALVTARALYPVCTGHTGFRLGSLSQKKPNSRHSQEK